MSRGCRWGTVAIRWMRSVAFGLGLALLLMPPARAAEPLPVPDQFESPAWNVPTDLRDDMLTLLFEEIAILVELEAFAGPVPPQLRQVHEAYEALPSGRDTGLQALGEVDTELQTLKIEMLAFEPTIPPPTAEALEEIEPRFLQRLTDGENRFLPSLPYIAALGTLLSNGAANQLGRPDPGAVQLGLEDELEALADAETFASQPAPTDAEDPTGPTPLIAAATIAAIGAAGITAVVLRRRRRDGTRNSDLSNVTRLLLAAATEQEVGAVAVTEAVQRTAAEGGLLVRPLEDGVRSVGSPVALGGTLLAKVAQTGAAIVTIADAGPGIGPHPAAVAAVPVVTGGVVEGVLVVHRSPDRPFDAGVRDILEHLAPTVAAALANVDRLGSMERLALVDGLTQLGNRRRLDRDLDITVAGAAEEKAPVAFAMVDVDHFKAFNDQHGHAAGDAALCEVAKAIAANVRDGDIVYRYGGEEFSILLPYATAEEAAMVAERVRAAVEARPIHGEHTQPNGRLTISVGISSSMQTSADAIKRLADDALYQAKQAGRNRVVQA